MKVGLIGFGKAGKAVANVILQHEEFSLEWVLRDSTVMENGSAKELLGITAPDPAVIVSQQGLEIGDFLDAHPVDAIIDFSTEDGIYTYGEAAAERQIKIISAISHYHEHEKEFLKKLSENTVVFWSPNITLGVNYLLFAASMLKNIAPEVDIELIEEHFKAKAGISGTAVKIAETLDIRTESINSVRAGGIVGKHEVIFGFPYQTVRLVHESISREAFGNGALFVARNLKGKENGLYHFEDILKPYFFNEAQPQLS
ncbi:MULTISPECIES: 4-hydroxy-tetrahydrodipicolinate reductase [Chryseobacterium]|uniref:4-hydroxy-tetrahydrodipicolinate reductase n=1 Tax=Chryseobacterium camelliae TaxID=1265445 RepID=A0ABU0TIG9_9FLAO|nr:MULTISPECIES: dihydrodipicolinate reductase C-terminal domain-containing protein [Chryseobacterium]MDT3409298.1 4-hydroxy-tetrahydrodipicolinate reductase [Pseudacidovorax intermedius]MDQ1096838.1 4-hydroxy-tetrahydrodipicolinate reductase [Chryseobacterium camelliae]MDQ1100779.1 4-hydroxy-tetrahydrodipicolinate reductase [Chryseobacterium sp. SORGH_AS_1048]MDR6084223.1 4-hydroxy-tetrahydrodipicolinate reductase [Chryseobacterium sp. SORGH_AS_0909]MDR6132495.1 4-hydroxy-tetrahydrodipicolina